MDLGCGGVVVSEGEIMFICPLEELVWTTRPDLLVHVTDPSILGFGVVVVAIGFPSR